MRIRMLEILTRDLKKTKNFYLDKLGLQLTDQSADHFSIALPDSSLRFRLCLTGSPIYHIAFTVPSNQIEDSLHWIRSRAELIPVNKEEYIADFSNWNAQALYFFDNNGNILELIGRTDLHNENNSPFTSSSILAISEVGIVTEDVKKYCEALITNFGLEYFSRQPPQKDFAAVGEDSGLFIVVPQNRNWYPTKIKSTKSWLKLQFEHRGKEYIVEN